MGKFLGGKLEFETRIITLIDNKTVICNNRKESGRKGLKINI